MRDLENIQELILLQPDYLGFIFYSKSPRYINPDLSEEYSDIPNYITKTGVFVNEDTEKIISIAKKFKLQAIQLHGNESPATCIELQNAGFKVIKAFGINTEFEFQKLEAYVNACDYFLFDTKVAQHGGSGKKFNWKVLDQYPYDKMFFLSGGIESDDAETIVKIEHPLIYAIDINSCFEIAPALKDVKKVKSFIEKVRLV